MHSGNLMDCSMQSIESIPTGLRAEGATPNMRRI
jgi:hypothetical protein